MNKRPSLEMLLALSLSVVLHITVFVCVAVNKDTSFREPLQIIPIEVCRLIIEPVYEQTVPRNEQAFVRPVKQEPLPNIDSKGEFVHPKKSNETPKPAFTPTLAERSAELQGRRGGQDDFSVVPSVEAQPLEQITPTIPDELRTQEYKSYVRVKVEIAADGSATASLRTSSGNQEIDERVLEALHKWRWRPAVVDGISVNSVRYFKFEFEVK